MAGLPAQTNSAWTSTSGNFVEDARAPNYYVDNGSLWVVWTPGTGGKCATSASDAQVYAYITVDSTVANRCLFAHCTLNVTNGGATPANLLPGVTETTLPTTIQLKINGRPVSIAATEILPTDARFAMYSALAKCGRLSSGTQFVGLGYGPGPEGMTINSSYSTKKSYVLDFNIYGYDPFHTTSPIPAYTVTPVGAAPLLVVVNTSNNQGFGLPAVQNINRTILESYFTGISGRTADLLPQAFAGAAGTVFRDHGVDSRSPRQRVSSF